MKRTQRLLGVFIVLVMLMLLASMGNTAMAQDQGEQTGTSTQTGGGRVAPPTNNNPDPEPEPEPAPPAPEPPAPSQPEPQPRPSGPSNGAQGGSQSGTSSSTGSQGPGVSNPEPESPPPSGGTGGGSGEFWILVDKSSHMLYAYRGNTVVFSAINNVARSGYNTPTGTHYINTKLESQDMTLYGYLPDVPHVMYFTNNGHAIHGTYWTAVNGRDVSHGCVNLSEGNAATLYNMTPIGTRVVVQE